MGKEAQGNIRQVNELTLKLKSLPEVDFILYKLIYAIRHSKYVNIHSSTIAFTTKKRNKLIKKNVKY